MNLVRPDRAKAVEQYILKLASTGSIRRKLSEDDIVEILNGVAKEQQQQSSQKIVFSRKETLDDDEDDFFD